MTTEPTEKEEEIFGLPIKTADWLPKGYFAFLDTKTPTFINKPIFKGETLDELRDNIMKGLDKRIKEGRLTIFKLE